MSVSDASTAAGSEVECVPDGVIRSMARLWGIKEGAAKERILALDAATRKELVSRLGG